MAKVFASYVHVEGEDGEHVVFAPGDTLPKWAEGLVTNPAAFVEGESAEAVTSAPIEPAPAPAPIEPAPPVADAPASAPVTTGPPSGGYASLGFKELQALAKSRALSGQGNVETLIARLEAGDRDDAADKIASATKSAADIAATTSQQ